MPALRGALVQMQVALQHAPFPILLVVAGDAASGKGDVVNLLNAWLDPRGVETFAFHEPTDEERERPPMWRYWRCLPPRGRMAIYAGGWHADALRANPHTPHELDHFAERLRLFAHFERLLADGGALIVKVWLQLSQAAQRERLLALESDPDTAWRVTADDWQHNRDYEHHARLSEQMRRATHKPGVPWHVIDATDPRARNLAVTDCVLASFRRQLAAQLKIGPAAKPRRTVSLRPAGLRRLLALRLDQPLSEAAYGEKRDKWLGRLHRAVRTAAERGRSIVWVFEGWDAAGKGGAIRRLCGLLDAAHYQVFPIPAPTPEEKARHYLWRFWNKVPAPGHLAVFDRSWFGRVMVERVEGFAKDAEWARAYAEINDFEARLAETGMVVLKLWINISKEEQLRRFHAREISPHKRHKMTKEDYRNRKKWDENVRAAEDMIARTDTPHAPWVVVSGDDKRYARVATLKAVCRALSDRLD